jgi:hypothetical protein
MGMTPQQIADDLDRWATYMSVGREYDAYQPEGVRVLTQAAAVIREKSQRATVLEDALRGTAASLIAAISLLERTPAAKKAAPSDTMFAQMLADYNAALNEARAALAAEEPRP